MGRKFTSYQSIILFRKFKADQLFTGHEILSGDHVLITDEKGYIIDLINEKDAGDEVEKFSGFLSPGFINCHCHLELSHLKGFIPKQTGLVDFVFKVVTERHFEEAEILSAIEKGENEMCRNGIVAVGDICNTPFTIPQKIKGNLYYHNFIEVSGFTPGIAALRFDRSHEFYKSYAAALPANSIVPHAPYSVSPEIFHLINDFSGNEIITIHNQEINAENEFFENKQGDLLRMYEKMNIDISFFKPSGENSLHTFLPYLNKQKSLILVHNVYTSGEDIEFARLICQANDSALFFCLCPNANLYISNALPEVNKFIDQGVNIVLGTDSLASNDQLSILEEIKTLRKNFPSVDFPMLLKWATINGARALGIDKKYGSFEKGKSPGILLIAGVKESAVENAIATRLL